MATDHIDRLTKQWRDLHLADIDPAPLAVTGRILRIAQHLEQARLEALSQWGLTLGDFDVLATLRRSAHDRGINPRDLLAETMITSGAMTTRLDRLEARRYITRTPDPHDRRGILVSLTDAGRVAAEEALRAVMREERALLAALSVTERKNLATSLRSLVLACEASTQ